MLRIEWGIFLIGEVIEGEKVSRKEVIEKRGRWKKKRKLSGEETEKKDIKV